MIPALGEEDACVWQEIKEWAWAFAEAIFWIFMVGVIAGSAAALVVLRWIA